ncbi:MAG TPA: SRPBCC family protein [Candidatus Binataceae bacterium]|nr:SRPBCC family protein [Candidatus Binataceae bacterium]
MWTILKIVGLVLVVSVGGILIYAATMPKDFRVSRSITINAPPEKIFPLINDLKSFNEWNPFAKQDPSNAIAYSGPQKRQGRWRFVGQQGQSGKGSLAITDTAPPSRVNMRLDMEKPMEGHTNIVFALQSVGTATEVSWTMAGPYPYIQRVFGTVFNMDKMIGGAFVVACWISRRSPRNRPTISGSGESVQSVGILRQVQGICA